MNTTQLSTSLRKAAVLISALDESSADALLAQMGPEEAAKVRSALMVLDNIPAAEQQRVLAEFFQRQGGGANAAAGDDVLLELDPAVEAAAGAAASQTIVPSFAFLEQVESPALARVLSGEHPQTVAVVVAQLSPVRAAALLEQLPTELATNALERIAWLDELSVEIKSDLARALRERLAPHIKDLAAGATSLARLTAVLSAMEGRRREQLTAGIVSRNAALREHLRLDALRRDTAGGESRVPQYRLEPVPARRRNLPPPDATASDGGDEASWLDFADLLLLDDAAIRAVFAEVNSEVALLALTGADSRLVSRIVRKLPAAQAQALRQRLEHPGPVRLREIEQARVAVAAVASRLAQTGEIPLPASLRFAAAV